MIGFPRANGWLHSYTHKTHQVGRVACWRNVVEVKGSGEGKYDDVSLYLGMKTSRIRKKVLTNFDFSLHKKKSLYLKIGFIHDRQIQSIPWELGVTLLDTVFLVKFRSQHCLIIHDVQSIKQEIPKTANENNTLISLASNTNNWKKNDFHSRSNNTFKVMIERRWRW